MESQVVSLAVPSVLVVEDDSMSRALMCTMIARTFPHLTVHSAGNGKDGLAVFEKHRPRIVVTNLKMPEMDGVSMVKKIGCADSNVRFIVMTGYSEEMKKFYELDVEYQVKPIAFRKIMSSIRSYLDLPAIPNALEV